VYQSTVTDAKVDSLAAFGQADFHLSEEATLSLGLRQTKERKTNRVEQQLDRAGQDLTALSTAVGGTATDLADAQAIRAAQVITPFSSVSGTPINASLTAWNVSPSYKVADDVLVYTSLGQGVKSGFIFFDPNNLVPGSAGFEAQIKPEKTLDFELGAKSLLLDRALQLNANVYYSQISDYQATWTRDNTGANAATVPTLTQWGNAEKVLARGIEVESAYQVNSNLSLNANGAYNKATYETQWLVAKPELATTTQTFDAKGQQIANAPLVTLSYGGNYETTFLGLSARASLSNAYKSSFYFNDNHSENTKQDAYTISNLGLAVGAPNKDWELSLLVKNVFNTEYALSKATWTKTAAQNLRVGNPRYYGLTFKSKF
jgi:iron complex outermembrane receptor protein